MQCLVERHDISGKPWRREGHHAPVRNGRYLDAARNHVPQRGTNLGRKSRRRASTSDTGGRRKQSETRERLHLYPLAFAVASHNRPPLSGKPTLSLLRLGSGALFMGRSQSMKEVHLDGGSQSRSGGVGARGDCNGADVSASVYVYVARAVRLRRVRE